MQQEGATTGSARIYAVTSGKGGVGKTNIVLNLAIALAEAGRRVLVLDADQGLANLDVLLGIRPLHAWSDVLLERCSVEEALIEGPKGVKILAADSGVEAFTRLGAPDMIRLFSLFRRLQSEADTILIDTSSGISSNVLYFSSFAHRILLVATPEPTSLTDAYATMKLIARKNGEQDFQLTINLVESERQGLQVYHTLRRAAEHFLKFRPGYAGFILKDANVPRAVSMQKPVMLVHPQSRACRNLRAVARKLAALESHPFAAEPANEPCGSPWVASRHGVTVH